MSELSEQGQKDALRLLEQFRRKMHDLANEVMGNLYVDVLPYLETDAWLNYREKLRLELQNKYVNRETCTSDEAWAKMIREAIFVQFKEELTNGIIKDLQTELDNWKKSYYELQRMR